jgi:hypothetical protein
MTTIQSRRKLIVIILLCVAVGGALLRHFAPAPSTARDVGTLLMLLWIPIVGNIIGWLIGRLRKPAVPAVVSLFDDAAHAFTPQLSVEFTLRPPQLPSEDKPVVAGEHRCALVVDNEGFSARWFVAPGTSFRRGDAQTLPVEFLTPALALPKFQPGTIFRMMVDDGSFVGDGRVLDLLTRP